jgi:DNA-binding transcriptional ArsR family regulator
LTRAPSAQILNRVLNQYAPLDLLFHALADPTRRVMVERLSRGPATVSDLARPLAISLPAVLQHLQVLEGSGLVRSEKVGRVRTCRLEPGALGAAERWIAARRTAWERRLDRLGALLAELPDESADGSTS